MQFFNLPIIISTDNCFESASKIADGTETNHSGPISRIPCLAFLSNATCEVLASLLREPWSTIQARAARGA